jgi:hypothetical protein
VNGSEDKTMGSTNSCSAIDGISIMVEDDSNILIAFPDGPNARKTWKYKFKTHEEAEDALVLLATRKASLADYNNKKLDE